MNEALLIYLVMGFGVMLTVLCAWSAFQPDGLKEWVLRVWNRPGSVFMAVGVRVLLGVALLVTANVSRAPLALTIVGWLVIAGAVFVVVAGKQRVTRIIEWAIAWPPLLTRVWAVFGMAFGIFLVWSVT